MSATKPIDDSPPDASWERNLKPERSRYWIERSAGFSVESRAGRIGIVEETPVGAGGRVETLVVRMRDRGLVIVPVQCVEAVLLRERRIFLAEPESV